MRIFITFILVLYFSLSPSVAEAPNGDATNTPQMYDDELKEFHTAGMGLLLEKGEESLLQDLKDNSNIMRGSEDSGTTQVNQGNIDEAFKLYAEGKYDTAFKKLLDIARTGHPAAQETVGLMLANGQGIAVDEKQSIRWLERAANKLRPLALHYLGTMYFQGRGVKRDIVKGAMWLSLANEVYLPDSDELKQAEEDLKNIMLRLSLREQRGAQNKVEGWKENHKPVYNAFKRRRDAHKIKKEKERKEKAKKEKERKDKAKEDKAKEDKAKKEGKK